MTKLKNKKNNLNCTLKTIITHKRQAEVVLVSIQTCYIWNVLPRLGLGMNKGAGCSSVDSVPAFEAVGRRIDPSQWTQLQFGLFSVPTSAPQLVYQRPWYVLFCLWKSAYKRSLAAYRKE